MQPGIAPPASGNGQSESPRDSLLWAGESVTRSDRRRRELEGSKPRRRRPTAHTVAPAATDLPKVPMLKVEDCLMAQSSKACNLRNNLAAHPCYIALLAN